MRESGMVDSFLRVTVERRMTAASRKECLEVMSIWSAMMNDRDEVEKVGDEFLKRRLQPVVVRKAWWTKCR